MNNMIVSPAVRQKLREKHDVEVREVEQAFENLCGLYLEDDREDHKTDPATLWFIAPTNRGRLLKVIFIFIEGKVHIKSAFEPHDQAIAIYDRYGK